MRFFFFLQRIFLLCSLGNAFATELELCSSHNNNDEIEIYTIPVGQGDGTIIKCPGEEGKITILDMGNSRNKRNFLQRGIDSKILIKFLNAIAGDNWESKVDNIFLTHPDRDHISFFEDIRKEIDEETANKVIN